MPDNRESSSALTDALIGAVAGAIAVWALDRVDWFAYNRESPRTRARTRAVRPGGMDPAHVLADMAAKAVGYDLQAKQDNAVGMAVHYSIGVAPAAIYGALRQQVPAITTGHGALFGLGLFLLQDEGLNAVTGLSASPEEYPWQVHARGLAAHLTYGLVLETALRVADGMRGTIPEQRETRAGAAGW